MYTTIWVQYCSNIDCPARANSSCTPPVAVALWCLWDLLDFSFSGCSAPVMLKVEDDWKLPTENGDLRTENPDLPTELNMEYFLQDLTNQL